MTYQEYKEMIEVVDDMDESRGSKKIKEVGVAIRLDDDLTAEEKRWLLKGYVSKKYNDRF